MFIAIGIVYVIVGLIFADVMLDELTTSTYHAHYTTYQRTCAWVVVTAVWPLLLVIRLAYMFFQWLA